MGTKHVIAYAMHEAERDLAAQQVENAQVTESYVIGDIDEDRIEELERAGLVVDEVPPAGRPTTNAMARGTMSAESGVEGWRPGDDDEIPPPEPGTPTQWLVSLTSPLMGEMREAIAATGAELDEYVPNHAYVATATPEQAAEVINLPFVRDVERYGPSKTGPIVLTAGEDQQARPPRHEYGICGSPMRPYALRSWLGLSRTTSRSRAKVAGGSGWSCLTTLT